MGSKMRPFLRFYSARLLWTALWFCALSALSAREEAAHGARRGGDEAQAIKPPEYALAYPAKLPTPFTLAYSNWNGLLMTHALVGGQFRGLVLDTALNGCALKPDISKTIGLAAAEGKTQLRVFDETVSVDLTHLPKLTFSLLSMANVPVGL